MEYPTTRFSLPSSSSLKKPISNFSSLSINSINGSYIPYYDTYPENTTISLELFQSLAIERLKILKTIEQVLARLNTTLSTAPTNKKDEIEKLLRKELKDKLNHLKVRIKSPGPTVTIRELRVLPDPVPGPGLNSTGSRSGSEFNRVRVRVRV
jgi:hypothetical protein